MAQIPPTFSSLSVAKQWERSAEYRDAFFDWLTVNGYARRIDQDGIPVMSWSDAAEFQKSEYFRNARLAFRRRLNGSPDAETT